MCRSFYGHFVESYGLDNIRILHRCQEISTAAHNKVVKHVDVLDDRSRFGHSKLKVLFKTTDKHAILIRRQQHEIIKLRKQVISVSGTVSQSSPDNGITVEVVRQGTVLPPSFSEVDDAKIHIMVSTMAKLIEQNMAL